jgi:hypothetical protein
MALTLALTGVADAEWIEVKNSGFESPVISTEGSTSSVLTNWSLSSGGNASGAGLNPSISQFPGQAPEGQNVAWSSNREIFQYLDAVVLANTTYTLQVEVGNRLDKPFAGYRIRLYGLNISSVTLAEDRDTVSPADGNFETSTLVFTTGSSDETLGRTLGISLFAFNGVDPYDAQACFDNVRLEATMVPEPTDMIGLSGMLLIGLVGYLWRRYRVR